MPGILVLVVGPSGAGKDSLIDAAKVHFASQADYIFVRRVITRQAVHVAEDHDCLTPAGFAAAAQQGAFFLHWQAHGLYYGLPASTLANLRQGRVVIANVSRSIISTAQRLWPDTVVILITAAPEILAERVAARARSDDGDVQQRIARKVEPALTGLRCISICNEGTLATAATAFCAALHHIRERSTLRST